MDNLVAEYGNRSKIIEIALNEFFTHKRRELRDNNDLELINSNIDDLNKEAEDTISYQVKIWIEENCIGYSKDQNEIQREVVFFA